MIVESFCGVVAGVEDCFVVVHNVSPLNKKIILKIEERLPRFELRSFNGHSLVPIKGKQAVSLPP
jgi:hypothetical protein